MPMQVRPDDEESFLDYNSDIVVEQGNEVISVPLGCVMIYEAYDYAICLLSYLLLPKKWKYNFPLQTRT